MFPNGILSFADIYLPWSSRVELRLEKLARKVTRLIRHSMRTVEKQVPLTLPDMIRRYDLLSMLYDYQKSFESEKLQASQMVNYLTSIRDKMGIQLKAGGRRKIYYWLQELEAISLAPEQDAAGWEQYWYYK